MVRETLPMTVDITIPSPGESITEVTLGAWKKQDGAWIEKDDLLAEIGSDKATLELRAPASGALKILQLEGDTVKVGAAVAAVDTNASRPAGSAATQSSAPAPVAATASASDSVRASGVAKKVAAEKGVDLAAVRVQRRKQSRQRSPQRLLSPHQLQQLRARATRAAKRCRRSA